MPVETAVGRPIDVIASMPRRVALEKAEIAELFGRKGLGENPLINRVYLMNEASIAVGVAPVTAEMTEGHFGLARGVDYVRALRETAEAISLASRPLAPHRPLTAIDQLTFDGMATSGAILNAIIEPGFLDDQALQLIGVVWNSRVRTAAGRIGFAFNDIEPLQPQADAKIAVNDLLAIILEPKYYLHQEATQRRLSSVGYGQDKMRVDSVYIATDGKRLGRFKVSAHASSGKKMRPEEALEFVGQTSLFGEDIQEGKQPVFTGVRWARFYREIEEGEELYALVERITDETGEFIRGTVLNDNAEIVTECELTGSIRPVKVINRLKESTQTMQDSSTALFPASLT